VYGDLCGPISLAMPSGSNYFLLLIDDRSRFMWVNTLANKAQVAAAIMDFQSRAEGESGCKLKVLRTDHGGEFNSKTFAEYCVTESVRRQLTTPYSPQQNGVVERRNAMVVGAARSMMKAKALPGWFWGEAVVTTVYLLNRVPCKAVEGRTPFEVWYGRKPGVHHLKVVDCIVYVRNTTPHLKKLEDRGRKMIFVGYERGSKAYRAYDPLSGRVTITRDVVFDEEAQWAWSEGSEAEGNSGNNTDGTFTIQYRLLSEEGGEAAGDPVTPPASPAGLGAGLFTPPSGGHFATLRREPDEDDLDIDHDDAPLWLHAMDDVLGAATPPSYAARELSRGGDDRLLIVSAEEPGSVGQAMQEVVWRKAMEEELRGVLSRITKLGHSQSYLLAVVP
jgi:hypothetical protein